MRYVFVVRRSVINNAYLAIISIRMHWIKSMYHKHVWSIQCSALGKAFARVGKKWNEKKNASNQLVSLYNGVYLFARFIDFMWLFYVEIELQWKYENTITVSFLWPNGIHQWNNLFFCNACCRVLTVVKWNF